MGKLISPDSFKLTASSSSWPDFLSAFNTHVSGTSGNDYWSVVSTTDNTGSGGDYGMTITPTDANENFQVNLRYESNDGQLYMLLDPNSNITSDIDPVNNSSSAASNERILKGEASPSFNTEFLVCEWVDAFAILFKDTNNNYTPTVLHGGRIYLPFFEDDPERGLEGFGLIGSSPEWGASPDRSYAFLTENNSNNTSEIQIPGGWTYCSPTPHFKDNDTYDDAFDTGDGTQAPTPIVLYDWELRQSEPKKVVGYMKYIYTWGSTSRTPLTRLDSGSGDGFLYMSHNGNNRITVIGWDPAVAP